MDRTLTYSEAVDLLTEYARVVDSRDDRIRQAYDAHLNKAEIARRMGLDRGTVIRVLGNYSEEG